MKNLTQLCHKMIQIFVENKDSNVLHISAISQLCIFTVSKCIKHIKIHLYFRTNSSKFTLLIKAYTSVSNTQLWLTACLVFHKDLQMAK